LKRVFIDSAFYIALLDSRSSLHQQALATMQTLLDESASFTTTHGVLLEVFAFFSRRGAALREAVVLLALDALQEPTLNVVAINADL
jgi:predicted nucleic acid-binding protein